VAGGACRFCGVALRHVFVDLGSAPLSNAFLRPVDLGAPETYYPLRVMLCHECLLVQLPALQSPQTIFSEYPYFSSYSDTWLEHVDRFAAQAVKTFGLTDSSLAIEVGSNDGCLLSALQLRGVRILGIEPARNVAAKAVETGVPTIAKFFTDALAQEVAAEHGRADLVVANNVLAQVPELNDFIAGLKTALAPGGVLSIEVPHLVRLMAETQFDTIYHEHFSYFCLTTVDRILRSHGLAIFDVEALPTHGGSLRILAAHSEDASKARSTRVDVLEREEADGGYLTLEAAAAFAERVMTAKRNVLRFLIDARERGVTVVGYGAPAKGNTLLNYCGIRADLLQYTVDRSPHKQGLFLPGSRIPIYAPERLSETKPDIVLILPWNLRDEISSQLTSVREWGGRLAVAIPAIEVL
jgi:SAM-dependent methyltransferase